MINGIVTEAFSFFARHQFFRYLCVGVFNTCFSYGLFAGFLYLEFDIASASLFALLIGIVISFFTQSSVVFKNITKIAFLKFFAAWTSIYFLNLSIISILVRFDLTTYVAGAIATVPMTILSYVILRLIVFRKSEVQVSIS